MKIKREIRQLSLYGDMPENEHFSYFYINTDYINCFFLELPAELDGDIFDEIPKYTTETHQDSENSDSIGDHVSFSYNSDKTISINNPFKLHDIFKDFRESLL